MCTRVSESFAVWWSANPTVGVQPSCRKTAAICRGKLAAMLLAAVGAPIQSCFLQHTTLISCTDNSFSESRDHITPASECRAYTVCLHTQCRWVRAAVCCIPNSCSGHIMHDAASLALHCEERTAIASTVTRCC